MFYLKPERLILIDELKAIERIAQEMRIKKQQGILQETRGSALG
jgi:hypothetical protein